MVSVQVTIFFSLDDYQRVQVSDALKSQTFEKDMCFLFKLFVISVQSCGIHAVKCLFLGTHRVEKNEKNKVCTFCHL